MQAQDDRPRKAQSKVVRELALIKEKIAKEQAQSSRLPWAKGPVASALFGAVIVANGAFLGVDIELGRGGFDLGLWIIESMFLVIFIVEIVLRFIAERPRYLRYFDAWGCFDLAITILGCADTWVLTPLLMRRPRSVSVVRMLRIARLVRLVRVLRYFNQLMVVVCTLIESVRAAVWMMLLLGLVIYVGSIFTVVLLGQPYSASDPLVAQHFGSLGSALFAHFSLVMLEGWEDVAHTAMNHNKLWAFYFIGMIVLTNLSFLNIVVGMIVERMSAVSIEQEVAMASFVARSDQFRSTLRTLFNAADLDFNGEVTFGEIRDLLQTKETKELFKAFGINLHAPPHMLNTIMGLNRDGVTNFQDFADACLRLNGSCENIRSLFVQYDVCELHDTLAKDLDKLEEQLELLRAERTGLPPEQALPAMAVVNLAALNELRVRLDRLGHGQQQARRELRRLREAWHTTWKPADDRYIGPKLPQRGVNQERNLRGSFSGFYGREQRGTGGSSHTEEEPPRPPMESPSTS